jgi:DNA polymerase-4
VVPRGGELAFLHPLAVERLWGVGPVTSAKLRERGLTTVGEVARLPEAALCEIVGPAAGRHLHALAHNRDPRAVRTRRRRRSIGAQRALGRGPHSWEAVDASLLMLVDRAARRMRAARRACRTVTVRIRFGDFSRATRSHTLSEATAATQTIVATARGLLAAATGVIERKGITLVGVALGNLVDDHAIQLALPFARDRAGAIDATVDQVRERFGSAAITRASLLGREPGFTVPLLPD